MELCWFAQKQEYFAKINSAEYYNDCNLKHKLTTNLTIFQQTEDWTW